MISFLEELLDTKTKGTPGDVLFAQWSYDKRLVPMVLQSISNLFPHYSLHDESHSVTILNNIIRILGKRAFKKLSAIDIWLLLEAAYWHDIGMVVSGDQLKGAIESEAFLKFFKEVLADKGNGLNEYAQKFQIKDEKLFYTNHVVDLESIEGLKFILAEFFRRIHADRSSEIVNAPLLELHLSSPRTVIPVRLFKLLGAICSSHTKDFSEVMQLPFREVGIDVEDAHPRFISCLLRLGDLLDLDNNRFSEVMLRTLVKIPMDTFIHKSKHLAIDFFRVDNHSVKITAICHDYETANVTQHWFNYLNSEIRNQMMHWNNIAPSKKIGHLPTVDGLKVELQGYEYIDATKRPKFTVDTNKALGLLQGAGLYNGPQQCIREILQNALDSSQIRIWLDHSQADLTKPNSKHFIEIKKDYPIDVRIKKGSKGDKKIRWQVEIEDRGIGISKSDLKFITNTGSSSKNHSKFETINKMPKWLQPSGIFGIGFQSVFMITDQVIVETKSYYEEELLKVELNAPNSAKEGNILIRKLATTHKENPGTKITFDIETLQVPETYSVSMDSSAYRVVTEYDPFYDDSMDIEISLVIDEIISFSKKSCLPVRLFVDNKLFPLKDGSVPEFDYFDTETFLEFSVSSTDARRYHTSSIYFKGQPVESRIGFAFLDCEVNIHGEKASDILTLNRNTIKGSVRQTISDKIRQSLVKYLKECFDQVFNDDTSKPIGSMFLILYSNVDQVANTESQFNHWEKFEIDIDEKKINLKSLLNQINKLKITYDRRHDQFIFGDTFGLLNDQLTITIRQQPHYDFTRFLFYILRKDFVTVENIELEESSTETIVFSKGTSASVKDKLLKHILVKHAKNGISARTIIPCVDSFKALRLKDSASISYVYQEFIDGNLRPSVPKMLSPFHVKYTKDKTQELHLAINDQLKKWVYLNRFDDKTTAHDIETAYSSFVNEAKQYVTFLP